LAGRGERELANLLAHTCPALKQRSSVIIITPDVVGDWLDSIVLLMRQGIAPTVLLLDSPVFQSRGKRDASFGERGAANRTLAALSELEIAHYRITPDLLDRPEAQPGQIGRWRKTPQGRWKPEFHRSELSWRRLV
jgi:hypothetical protein